MPLLTSLLALLLLQPPAAPTPPAPPAPTTAAQPAPDAKWSDALRGEWSGTIQLPGGTSIDFILKVTAADAATIAIPQQGLPDAPLSEVAISTTSMAFKLIIPKQPDAVCPAWKLTPSADLSSASGTMLQSGMTLKVTAKKLAAGEKPAGPNRPQTPKPPFPYTTREVAYESFDGAAMNGTLTLPAQADLTHGDMPPQKGTLPNVHPCILLITGSGIQDRDETILDHKPFALIADTLARAGIASLRVDDRGFGGARNPLGKDATTDTYTKDVSAGIDFLLKQPEIDPKRIGLLGHSEGGLIAPIVAAARPESVAFIILLAGPGVPGNEVLERQMAAILTAAGTPKAQIDMALARQKVTLTAIMAGDTAAARQSMRDAIAENSSAAGTPAPEGQALEDAVDGAMKQIDSPWMRYFLTCDPRPSLRKTKCPVLILNGGKDAQVVAAQNVPEITRTLLDSGNTNITARVFPNLNHLFQPSKTGGIDEYAKIEATMDPAVLDFITAWVSKVADSK